MTLIEPFPDFHRMIGPCQGGVPPKLANMWVSITTRLTGLFTQFKHPTMTLIFNVDFTNAVCSGLLFRPLYLSIPCGHLGEFFAGWGGSWMLPVVMSTSEKVGRGRFSIVEIFQNWCGVDQIGVGQGWMQFPHHRDLPKLAWLLHQIFTKVEAESLMKNNHFAAKGEQIYKKNESPYDMNRRFTIVGIYSQSFGKHPTWNQVNLIMLQ